MTRQALTLVLLAGLVSPSLAFAHDTKPAYLSIRETEPGRYAIYWKRPRLGSDEPSAVEPTFPKHCTPGPRDHKRAELAIVDRWSLDCGSLGLVGQTIEIRGLETSGTDVLLRISLATGHTRTERVRAAAPTIEIAAIPSSLSVAHTYVVLGIEHILLGIDHLLFVLGLLLLVGSFRALIATVSAFTVAHSITLALASLGVLRVPGPPVEAIIALSIVFLAFEVLHDDPSTITRRRPWIVAFTFGLLHGLGFAGALSEVGLPASDVPLALFIFNVGVEIGQLIFIAIVFGIRWLLLKVPNRDTAWVRPAIAYAIGGLASFWLIERVAGF